MEEQQELMFKLSIFQQQINQLRQQLQAVEQTILNMNSLNFQLDELVGSKGKEILAPIGQGIFAKTKLLSEELTVDIGGKNFVKKTIPETKKLIAEQIKKLEDVYRELNENLEKVGGELMKVYQEEQTSQGKKKK